jgi:hypothetical protein
MNSGLTSLMMWMLNSGNDKKRAEEYEKKQAAAEARQERLMQARDSLAQMRENARTADERKWQLDSETRKLSEKRADEERTAATKQEHINYGLKTMKQNSGVPFEAWAPHEQEAVLALPGMTIENAALIIAKINAGASVTQVKADLAKLNAAAAKDANDERAALTTAPYVERIAKGEAANKIARLNLGDRSPSDLVGPENMATVNPDMQGGFSWQKNPAFTKKNGDLTALLGGAGKTVDGIPVNPDLTPPKVIEAIDARGNTVPVTMKEWPTNTANTAFAQPATNAPPQMSRESLRFMEEVQRLQGEPPTTETVESLAEKYRREKEEQEAKYRLPLNYINRFSP